MFIIPCSLQILIFHVLNVICLFADCFDVRIVSITFVGILPADKRGNMTGYLGNDMVVLMHSSEVVPFFTRLHFDLYP